mmetsp:Transcript_11282/g.24432  ORF Transcript_11282/g.24432 Transcript_11282/m.24432 type:complete len:242 (-) Transcript_11282:511-1236(-)
MCRMLFIIPSSATCTLSSARLLTNNAGRISIATPMLGSGLISAPTQSARSVGSCSGGISPNCDSSASIWPGWRSFSFASSIHRSMRETLFFMFMFGSVNCFDFEIALATDRRSPVVDRPDGSSMEGLENCATSFSSSARESRNFTCASVQPSSVFSTSPSITNLRPARSEMSHASPASPYVLVPAGGSSTAFSIWTICTSTPVFSGTVWPVDSFAMPSMPSVGVSCATRCFISDFRVSCCI